MKQFSAVLSRERAQSRAIAAAAAVAIEHLEKRILFGFALEGSPPDYCRTGGMGGGPVGPIVMASLGDGGNPGSNSFTSAPVRYFDGTVKIESTDLQSFGFGSQWGLTRSWTNSPDSVVVSTYNSTGNHWIISQLPQLLVSPESTGSLGYQFVLVDSATDSRFFTSTGTSQIVRNEPLVLDPNDNDGDLTLVDSSGDTLVFYNPHADHAPSGRLKSFTDPSGRVTHYLYDDALRIESIYRDETVGGVNVRESYAFGYVHAADELPEYDFALIDSVTLERTVGTGDPGIVRMVQYEYYDDDDPHGLENDLKRATVKDAGGNIVSQDYYRYYTGSTYNTDDVDDPNRHIIGYAAANGGGGGLKRVFTAKSYDRLIAALAALPTPKTPDEATDPEVAPYADNYFEYDGDQRVITEVHQGTGCSTCAAGLQTITLEHDAGGTSNGDGYSGHDFNIRKFKTVESFEDGSQNIVYSNFIGESILRVHKEGDQQWRTYWRYDSMGRILFKADPSAVDNSFDPETSGTVTLDDGSGATDIIGYDATTGDFQFLRDAAGLIEVNEYYSSSATASTNTSTSGTAVGGAKGYLYRRFVQQGDGGISQAAQPVLQEQYEYYAHSGGAGTIYPLASDTVYSNDDATGAQQTTYDYTFFSNSMRVESATITHPGVTANHNGPGTSNPDIQQTIYDVDGRAVWTKDGDGHIVYTEFDPVTGSPTKRIVDVDTDETDDFNSLPDGWSNPDGLHLITSFVVDPLGRTTKLTSPNGNVTYTVYDDTAEEPSNPDAREVRVYPGWDSTTHTTMGPVIVYRDDRDSAGNSYVETLTILPSSIAVNGSGLPTGGETISNVQSDVRDYYNDAGQLVAEDRYFSLPSTWTDSATYGTINTNFYESTYGYDDRGRLERVELPTGTITHTVRDSLGRVTTVWTGTDDMVVGDPDDEWSPALNETGTSNMGKVSEYFYDGTGVGDGNLTDAVQHVQHIATATGTASDDRHTKMYYDWRDRLVTTKQGAQSSESGSTDVQRLITYLALDNLNHVLSREQYDGDNVSITSTNGVPNRPSDSLLRTKATSQYDDRGRVFVTHLYGVVANSGSNPATISSPSLDTNYWYDHRGNVIKISQPGGLVTKTFYDGANRVSKVYKTDGGGDLSPATSSWANAGTVDGDIVLTQTENQYDSDGNAIFTITKDRFHDASGTGELGTPVSTSSPKARVSYMAYYYDAVDRLTASVNVGTNYDSTNDDFTLYEDLTENLPSRSDAALLTGYAYDSAGRLQTVTDPRGIVGKTSYDALGRTTQTIENYLSPGTPTADSNRTTEYTYDGSNHVLTMKAVLPDGPDTGTALDEQTTEYVYGASTDRGDAINSNDVLIATKYPDKTPGTGFPGGTGQASDAERDEYLSNALGQRSAMADRAGTIHRYTYDVLGRLTLDEVADGELAAGVDGSVRALGYGFDSAGRAQSFTSYNASDQVVNQVTREYNGLGQLTREYQSYAGPVDAGTRRVQYAYSEMMDGATVVNHSRLVSTTYPSGDKVVTSNYASGLDYNISRLSSLSQSTTTLESYAYLGLGTVVERSHPDTYLTYISATAGEAGDQYAGLDRFGRVIEQKWTNGTAAVDDFTYGYDADGNRLYKDNALHAANGELYAYDDLNRLTDFARGTINSTHDGFDDSPSRGQSWTLDALGNWSGLSDNGDDPVPREHNSQNQLTAIGTGGGAATLAYDANGSMTTDQNGNHFTYDAWNRPARFLAPAGNILSIYRHDALGRRLAQTDLDPISGTEYTLEGTTVTVDEEVTPVNDTFDISLNNSDDLEIRRNNVLIHTIEDDTETPQDERELLLHFDGLGGADTLTIEDGAVVHLLNDGRVTALEDATTNLTISVSGSGTLLEFDSQRQFLGGLSIASGATARLQLGLSALLVTSGLTISQSGGAYTGTLDVADGWLIVRGTETSGTTSAVTSLIHSGFNESGTWWTGAGINSSAAAADNTITLAVGALDNNSMSIGGDGSALYDNFADISVDANDVLVRFTYFGDADLTGVVDITDYFLIDQGYNSNLSGWVNGDMDYNGHVNGDDYFLIDKNFIDQGPGRLEPKTRLLIYSNQWQVLDERKWGLPADQYVWSPVYVDAMVERDHDSNGNGTLDQRHYVEQDANFNVTSITNLSGEVVERYDYDPYGVATVLSPSWTADGGGTRNLQWIHLNQGMRYDAPAQVYINHGRLYSAILGRPISADLAMYVDGMNLYQRERSSPVNRLDPSGLDSGPTIGGFGGDGFDWQTDRATGGLGFDPASGEHRSIYDLDASGQIWPGGILPSDGGAASGDFWNNLNIDDIIAIAERMAHSQVPPIVPSYNDVMSRFQKPAKNVAFGGFRFRTLCECGKPVGVAFPLTFGGNPVKSGPFTIESNTWLGMTWSPNWIAVHTSKNIYIDGPYGTSITGTTVAWGRDGSIRSDFWGIGIRNSRANKSLNRFGGAAFLWTSLLNILLKNTNVCEGG